MEFEIIAIGLCFSSVCTSLPPEEAADRLNADYPTGISSRWGLAEEKIFNDGVANGCDCPDHAGNKHYLMSC